MYSLDFRKQVLQALEHRSFRQVAKDFGRVDKLLFYFSWIING